MTIKFIKIKGEIYTLLGMYGGRGHFGHPTDVNNESALVAVIWEKQPFFYENEMNKIDKMKVAYYRCIRFFKSDVFGRSGFKTLINKVKSKV